MLPVLGVCVEVQGRVKDELVVQRVVLLENQIAGRQESSVGEVLRGGGAFHHDALGGVGQHEGVKHGPEARAHTH